MITTGRSRAGKEKRAVIDVKYDWPKIELEYVRGRMSMEELAEKHQIPGSTFRKYANVHHFSQKRTEYGQKVAEKALARAQARDARTLSNVRGALDKAARLLNKYMADEDTLHGRVAVSEAGAVEYRVKKLDTKALRDMTAALKETTAAVRLLTDQAQSEEREGQAGVILMPAREDGI